MSKILMLDLAQRFGGASERAISILRKLPKEQAALVSLRNTPVTRRAESCGVTVYTVGKNKFDLMIGSRLRRIVQQYGYQVIDSQNPQSRYWGSFVSACDGVPHVATINSWPTREYAKQVKGYFYKYIDKFPARYTSHFIAVSPEIESELVASGIDTNKITMIVNSISVADIDKGNGDWKQSLGFPDGAIVCCAMARFIRTKGLRYLIEALGTAVTDAPNLYCVILGGGELRGALEKQIASLGLGSRIHLLGERQHNEGLAIVQDCDFFVMPSLSEGTPLALLEAGALGLPIITSAVGGIPEVVTDGLNGLLVPPADASALAGKLLWMVKHPTAALEMGRCAKATILEKFSMDRMVDQVSKIYDNAILGNS